MAVKIESVRLIVNGVICGETKGGDTLTTSDAVYSYGGDDWGLTLTGADVNSSNFGVVVSLSGLEATDTYSPAVSNYVKVTNFGFNIPSEDVISEITVFIEAKADAEGNASIDNIKIELRVFGVNSDEVSLISPSVLAKGYVSAQVNSDEVLFTSLSPSLIAGVNVSANSDEISLTSLSPSISGNASADMSVDEVSLTSLGIDSFSVSKDLTAIAFSIVNPVVSVDWDYLFINKPKNITNWSSKSKNSTTWIKRPKVLTNWEEI